MITFLNKKINKYYNIYLETLYFHKNKSQKYIIKIPKKLKTKKEKKYKKKIPKKTKNKQKKKKRKPNKKNPLQNIPIITSNFIIKSIIN